MIYFHSFWGKFGQRSNMKQAKYVYNQAEFIGHLLDQRKNVEDFYIVNEGTCVITYSMKDDFVQDCPTSNVVIATFTTCWARLRLLDVLHQVGERCLYFDTDSIIFIEKKDDQNQSPVELGDYLGDLTNELKGGSHITEFIGAGPKNYAYRENNGRETCKVRGFTLNHENAQLINFNSVKNLMLHNPKKTISLLPQSRITRDKRAMTINNRMEERNYGLVYTKRRLLPSFCTLPFGYVD